jgi:hypothetical protein
MGDWIPQNEKDLLELIRRWNEYLASTTLRVEFGWETEKCVNVQVAMDKFTTAVEKYIDDDSSENALTKKVERKASIAAQRDFAATDIRINKKMSPAQKLYMGVSMHDGVATHPAIPESYPACTVRNTASGVVLIDFMDSKTKKRARPKGVRGAEVLSVLGGSAPTADKDFIVSDFTNTSPIKLEFDIADRGKILYFHVRWENTENKKGPWSPIYTTVIT